MPFEFGFMVQSMILGRESKEIHQKSKMECDVQHCFRQMRFLIFQLFAWGTNTNGDVVCKKLMLLTQHVRSVFLEILKLRIGFRASKQDFGRDLCTEKTQMPPWTFAICTGMRLGTTGSIFTVDKFYLLATVGSSD